MVFTPAGGGDLDIPRNAYDYAIAGLTVSAISDSTGMAKSMVPGILEKGGIPGCMGVGKPRGSNSRKWLSLSLT